MGGVTCRHCCSGACCKHNKGYCQLVEGARSCPVKSTPPIILISRRTSPHPIPRARWCGADGGEPTAGPRPGARLPRALYDGIQGLPQGSSACPACAVSRQPCNRRSPSTTGATPGRSRRVPSLWSAVTRRTRCSPYSTTATRWLCSASLRICETTSPPLFRFLFDPRSKSSSERLVKNIRRTTDPRMESDIATRLNSGETRVNLEKSIRFMLEGELSKPIQGLHEIFAPIIAKKIGPSPPYGATKRPRLV